MGQIYGSERALLFGKPVPLYCQMQGRGWQKWDFFYYVFIIEFLSVSYRFLIVFNKNSHVNLLIILILGVEVLCSSGKFGCGALLIYSFRMSCITHRNLSYCNTHYHIIQH